MLALALAVLLSQNAPGAPPGVDRPYLERAQDVTDQPGFYRRFLGDMVGGALVAMPTTFVLGKELDSCGGGTCFELSLISFAISPVLIAGGAAFAHWLSGGRGTFLSALEGVLLGALPALAVCLISYGTTQRSERPEAVDYVMLPAAGALTAFTSSWLLEVSHSDATGWR